MFRRLTTPARHAVVLSQDEARLVALVREGRGVASRVLEQLGADDGRLLEALADELSSGSRPSTRRVGTGPQNHAHQLLLVCAYEAHNTSAQR